MKPLEALIVLQNLEKTLNRRGSNSVNSAGGSPKSSKSGNENESIEDASDNLQRSNSTLLNSIEIAKYQQTIAIVIKDEKNII